MAILQEVVCNALIAHYFPDLSQYCDVEDPHTHCTCEPEQIWVRRIVSVNPTQLLVDSSSPIVHKCLS